MFQKTHEFESIDILYKDIIRTVTEPQNYFSSEEYHVLKQLAYMVFDKVKSKCDLFLGIVRGTNKGNEIGHPGIERAMCFPSRFLKKPSTIDLPDTLRMLIDDVIDSTFYLGLISHLYLHTFPTRSNVERIDIDNLIYKWGLQALIADRLMKTYSKKANDLPRRVFESYYYSKIEPILKKQLKVGFWIRGQCRSYLRNLFFSGARLGMLFDLMTSEYSL